MVRPSHMSKERYRIDFEVKNRSRHPTEVEVDFYVFGYTDKLKNIYVMKRESRTEKLRAGQISKL